MSQELKRYTFESTQTGTVTARVWVHGPWVAHSDVAHLLRSHEALREALLTYKHRHESGGPMSEIKPDSCMCSACDAARAALTEAAAQEEKKP